MIENFDTELREILPEIYDLRWQIHRNPELGYEEFATTDAIENCLKKYGVIFKRFENMTGGYAIISNNKEKTLCFRADIDALPIEEQTGIENTSQNHGKMHACGHDVHTSLAVGLAIILQKNRTKLNKNVIILFQAAEECNPRGGAKSVIESGFFKKNNVESIMGLHIWPSLPVGTIAVKNGVQMGSSDKFIIDIKGKNSHAAEPHKGVDAILISMDLVGWLVQKLKREIKGDENFVLTIGAINSKGRYNIVCGEVKIEGTIRTVSEETREYVHKRINEISKLISNLYGGDAEVNILRGYDTVRNDRELTLEFIEKSKKVLGEENVITDQSTTMIGEDFSFYGNVLPACYFFLGCDSIYPLHNDKFLPNERCIEEGINLLKEYFLNNTP